MTRDERVALFADMANYGIRRFREGAIEVEAAPPAPTRTIGLPEGAPSGMPTREELLELKKQIDNNPTRVGPAPG
jgi:hypothetical protein